MLYEHAAVVEAAVVGRPDERWGEVPVAFVVAATGRDRRPPDELIEHCRGQLAKFKVPEGRRVHRRAAPQPVGQGPQAGAARPELNRCRFSR